MKIYFCKVISYRIEEIQFNKKLYYQLVDKDYKIIRIIK